MEIKSTQAVSANYLKMVVYGEAGAGKTRLIPTLPSPFILSAEGGLLSIREHNLPYVEIESMAAMTEAFQWIRGSQEAQGFASICIDSLSEISEICLNEELEQNKDPRKAYGKMADRVLGMLRRFRGLQKHVYFTAKMGQIQDGEAGLVRGPILPGKIMTREIPYLFDMLMAYRVNQTIDGATQRWLQTQPDGVWFAKDRSGALQPAISPDLGAIIQSVLGG